MPLNPPAEIKANRTRPQYTPDQREEIVKKYIDGVPLSDIAEEYGCDPSYPRQLYTRMGGTGSRQEKPYHADKR